MQELIEIEQTSAKFIQLKICQPESLESKVCLISCRLCLVPAPVRHRILYITVCLRQIYSQQFMRLENSQCFSLQVMLKLVICFAHYKTKIWRNKFIHTIIFCKYCSYPPSLHPSSSPLPPSIPPSDYPASPGILAL